MTRTTQTKLATAKVQPSVWVAKPLHIEEMGDDVGSLKRKLSSGHAFLKVVAYPWGVEFDVCEAEEGA